MIHHVGSILLRSNKPLLTSIFTAQLLTNAFVVLTLLTHVRVFSAEQDKSRQDRVSLAQHRARGPTHKILDPLLNL